MNKDVILILGWKTKVLSQVCEKITDGTHQTPKYFENGIIFLSSRNVTSGKIDWENVKYIDLKQHLEMHKRVAPKLNDILLAKNGTTGVAAIVDRDLQFDIYVSLALLRPLPEISPMFLLHFVNSPIAKEQFEKRLKGTGVPNLHLEEIRDVKISYPVLAEQERIVRILDEAFEAIATAKANAEKNLQNARAIFQTYLQLILSSNQWEWKVLGELCNGVEYGSSAKSKSEGKTPVLRMGNIQNGQIDWENLVYTDDEEEIEKYLLSYNDVLFNRTNSPELVGKTAIYKGQRPAIFAGYLIRINRKEKLLDGDYLNYFLNSQIALDYGKTVVISSVNQANINGAKLKGYPIPTPSISEQREIVKKLDGLQDETKRLESIYQSKLSALDALKKSLLHQAFSGQLTSSLPQTIIPFPTKVPDIATKDLHAGILAIAYQFHEAKGKLENYGHVKAEKIAHMVEAHLGIDLERTPIKDAAGPNDYPHSRKVEHRARMAGFFDFHPTETGAYQVKKLPGFEKLIIRTREKLGDRVQGVIDIMNLMVGMTTRQAEIFTTVYAAWNNLLLDGKPATDEDIVSEARENWHPAKMTIPREKFFNAIGWIRERNLMPKGMGKRVVAKA